MRFAIRLHRNIASAETKGHGLDTYTDAIYDSDLNPNLIKELIVFGNDEGRMSGAREGEDDRCELIFRGTKWTKRKSHHNIASTETKGRSLDTYTDAICNSDLNQNLIKELIVFGNDEGRMSSAREGEDDRCELFFRGTK